MITESTKRQYATLLHAYHIEKNHEENAVRNNDWDSATRHWKRCEELRAQMQEMVDSKQI